MELLQRRWALFVLFSMSKANKPMMSTKMPPHSIFSGGKIPRALFALLLVNICLIVYYNTFNYQQYFHSDSAMKNLLAQEIYETGQYFPPDWNYVNGDLGVLFGHTFILPLLPFFPNSFYLHAVSGALSAGLILIGTWCAVGIASESRWVRLATVVIVSSGISGLMAENLYGQVSYGAVYYVMCFIMYFAWRFLNEESAVYWIWGMATALAIGLAFWTNPQRAAASYGLPLFVAGVTDVACEARRGGWHWNNRTIRGVALLSLCFIGATAGTVLHSWVISHVNNIPGAGLARWLPFDGMLRNGSYTLQGILSVFGGLPTPSMPVVSVIGIYEAIRFISAIVLIVLLPLALKSGLQDQRKGTQFVSVFALVVAAIMLVLQITTSIPDMSDPVQSARYLIQPSLLLLVLCVIMMAEGTVNWSSRVLGGVALLVIAISAFPTLTTRSGNQLSWGLPNQIQNDRTRLVEFLKTHRLHYGYATYWNAGVLSVLSAQQVRVRQIQIQSGLPIPMRHLSSERWYRPSAWTGETFLLLNDNEAKAVNWDLLATYHGRPMRTLGFQEFQIYVFPQNIASGLPGWDATFETLAKFEVSPQSPHRVGRYLATNQRGALVADKGEAGPLLFGPYIRVLPGRYRVSFEVETTGDGASDFGDVDVASDQGRQIHTSQPVTHIGRQRIALQFSLEKKVDDLQFRVLVSGTGQVKVYSVNMVRFGD